MSNQVETFIPTKPNIAEGKDTNAALRVKNFADNAETVKKFYEAAHNQYKFHKNQPLRTPLEDKMDAIDKYCRVTLAATKQDADKTPDITSWKPPQFMSALEIVTANQCEVLFPRNELIGKFIPLNELDDASRNTTANLLRRQNLLFEYSNEIDNRIPKYQKAVWTAAKYGDCVIEMGWTHRVHKIDMPKKTGIAGIAGKIVSAMFKGQSKTQTESHSTLKIHDMKDFFCDLLLDDDTDVRGSLVNHQAVELRCRTMYGDLRQMQRDGHYKNVEKVNKNQLYSGETPDNRLQTRQDNAGENSDTSRATGEHEVWECWLRAPIDENGKWDEEGTAPTWHWATFCGKFDSQGLTDESDKKTEATGLVCLRLNPNPYPYDELPFTIIHAKRDDKGVMHKSYYEDAKSILEEMQSTFNEYIYNKRLINAAPFKVGRGAIFGNKKFDGGPTSLIEMSDGRFEELERILVNSNTQDSLAMLSKLESIFWEDIMLMPKGFRGQTYGSRATASETGTANAQAGKPFMDRVRYLGYQLVGTAARKNALYVAHFNPQALTKALLATDNYGEIKPEDVYGPLRYKLTCVDDYENNIMERAEQDRFATIWLPFVKDVIGKRGIIAAGKWAFKKRFAPIDEIFPVVAEGDAVANAQRENELMMREFVQPGQNEDDDTHIATHQAFLAVIKTQPPEESGSALQWLPAHVLMHIQRKQQQAQQAMQPAAKPMGLGSGESPATTYGEASGDMMGAEGGASMGGMQ